MAVLMRRPETRPAEPGARSSLRVVAAYLIALRPIVADAIESRQSWTRQLGQLLAQAGHGDAQAAAGSAGRIGREQVATLRGLRMRLGAQLPPPECGQCHQSFVRWIEKLTRACEVMILVGETGHVRRLNEVQDVLADARFHARSFNLEYTRLIGEVRRRAAAAPRLSARSAAARPTFSHRRAA
jgi:hypothetical protein